MTATRQFKAALLGSIATLSLTIAFPAFAQDSQVQPDPDVMTTEDAVTFETEDDMADTLEDAADDIEEVADDLAYDDDNMWDKDDADQSDKDKRSDTDPTSETPSSTTVTCPEGTEVQADNSCMVSGDWTPEG